MESPCCILLCFLLIAVRGDDDMSLIVVFPREGEVFHQRTDNMVTFAYGGEDERELLHLSVVLDNAIPLNHAGHSLESWVLPSDKMTDGRHAVCASIRGVNGPCVTFFVFGNDFVDSGLTLSKTERLRRFGARIDQEDWASTMQGGIVQIRSVNSLNDGDSSAETLGMDLMAAKALSTVMEDYMIESILDAHCGGMGWVSHVFATRGSGSIRYIGVDVISSVIESNQQKYANMAAHWMFIRHDFVESQWSSETRVDLIITRDTLQYLPPGDVQKFIENINATKANYWLASTWLDSNLNFHGDASGGGCTPINLIEPPYLLPPPLRVFRDLPSSFPKCRRQSEGNRYLALWKLPLPTLSFQTARTSGNGGSSHEHVQRLEKESEALREALLAPGYNEPCTIIISHPSPEILMRGIEGSSSSNQTCDVYRVLYSHEAAAIRLHSQFGQNKQEQPKKKWAIVTGATSFQYVSNFLPSVKSFLCYARAHNYEVYVGIANKQLLGKRNVQYVKIPALKYALQHHDGAFWLDLDTWFNIPVARSYPLTHYFEAANRKEANIAVLDGSIKHGTRFPNNGVFLLKAGKWSEQFLEDWWQGSADGIHWDQTSFQHAILSAMARKDPAFVYHGQCVGHYEATDRNACFISTMQQNQLQLPYDNPQRFPEVHFVHVDYEPQLQWWNGVQTRDKPIFVYHSGNSDGKGYQLVQDMFPIQPC